MKRHLLAVAASMAMLGTPVHASTLIESWRAAQQNDPEFAAAQAAHAAGLARHDQARSLWRPNVVLTGAVGYMASETTTDGAQFAAPDVGFSKTENVSFNTSITQGTATQWTLSARQPLINRERLAESRQLDLAADAADLQWLDAQQSLILRTAQRYYDVVLASETVRVLQRQKQAVDKTLVEVEDRFKLGDVPITDTHEARARAQGIAAQVLAAEADLQMREVALSDLTGQAPKDLQPQAPQPMATKTPPALDEAMSQAQADNPLLRLQQVHLAASREEVTKHSPTGNTSLDLVAQIGGERLSGSGDFGDASNSATKRMIGVQLTMPLFTGGYRSARQEESLRLADKAQADLELTRQQVMQQTRSAWLGLTVGAQRVSALEQALAASLSRLDATRVGHGVGHRTTLDLLNAENDAAQSELTVLQARIAYLLDQLRLAALEGRLNEQQLEMLTVSTSKP